MLKLPDVVVYLEALEPRIAGHTLARVGSGRRRCCGPLSRPLRDDWPATVDEPENSQ